MSSPSTGASKGTHALILGPLTLYLGPKRYLLMVFGPESVFSVLLDATGPVAQNDAPVWRNVMSREGWTLHYRKQKIPSRVIWKGFFVLSASLFREFKLIQEVWRPESGQVLAANDAPVRIDKLVMWNSVEIEELP